MGRAFTRPTVEQWGGLHVITRVMDPDDEFAEPQVLCEDLSGDQAGGDRFLWKPRESASIGEEVAFDRSYDAWRARDLMLFGRDSVSVEVSL